MVAEGAAQRGQLGGTARRQPVVERHEVLGQQDDAVAVRDGVVIPLRRSPDLYHADDIRALGGKP